VCACSFAFSFVCFFAKPLTIVRFFFSFLLLLAWFCVLFFFFFLGPTVSDEQISAYESGTLEKKKALKVSPVLSKMIYLPSKPYTGPKGE
jgi:hypothetical protein